MKPWHAALAIIATSSTAQAAEVQFEGSYQARARLFDTLSLNRTLESSEGFTWVMQHRLWLRPKFYITDQVGLFADVLALNNTFFGADPNTWIDPVSQATVPLLYVDDLNPPTGEDAESRADITLWRAWGEANTRIGTFKFGRQPLHWGMGLWQNQGTGLNQEYGDSADRVSWEHLFKDVWVRAAFDLHTAGLVTQTDESWSINLAGAYRTERIEGGLQFQYRRTDADDAAFDLYTLDGAFDLTFGNIGLDGEVVLQFGNGDLGGGVNDVSLFAAGFALDASIELNRWDIHLEGGFATGDDNPNDADLKSFTFDRDYNMGFMLFEQAMPTLVSAVPGEDRSYAVTQTGNAFTNGGYIRPRVAFRILPGFFADGQAVLAFTHLLEEDADAAGRGGLYGAEFDLGLRYEAIEHFELVGTLGVFVPGTFYSNYEDDTFSGFGETAVGGQFIARVRF